MSDLELEFDIVAGKNELPLEIERISHASKTATQQIKGMASELKKTGDEAKRGGIGSFASDLKSGFMSVAAPIGAVVAAVSGAVYSVKKFVDSAIEAEENISRLNVALKQTGIYSEQTSKDFQELATKIQDTTRYSDDQAMSLMSTLQNLGQFTKEGLVKATKASIDLASAMKIDLSSAALLVGKAASGNITAFQRMGIEIKKGKDDAETFANTLEALSRFQGASETDAKTLGGSFSQLGNQIGEVSETIGGFIVEALKLKEAAMASAGATRELNKALKNDAASFVSDNIINLTKNYGLMTTAINAATFAYKKYNDAQSRAANEQRFKTEDFLGKQENVNISALISPSIDNLAPVQEQKKLIEDIAKISKENEELLLDTSARRLEAEKKILEEREKQRKQYDSLFSQVKNAGKEQIQIIDEEYAEREKQANAFLKSGAITEIEFINLIEKLRMDSMDKVFDYESKLRDESATEDKRILEEQEKEYEQFAKDLNDARDAAKQQVSQIGGYAQNILQGKEGARSLISSGAGAVGEALLPGSGPFVSGIVSQLSQGPEATRAMVKEFAAAVPELISGIIDAIPVLIEELSNQFPKVIDAMVNKFSDPKFIESLTKAFIKAGISMAKGYVQSMINFIPDFFSEFGKNLISAIVDGVKQAIGAVGNVAGNIIESIPVVGGAVSKVGDWLGFAQGGQVNSVPNGFPNDTFPAMLSSGELVVDRSTVDKINDFIYKDRSSSSSISEALLVRIYDKLSEPMSVSTTANVNGKAFADIILNLNRSGARLTV